LNGAVGTCNCNPSSEITILSSPGCFDCTTLSYGPGTVTSNVCNCYSNFLWNSTSNTCYCPATWTLNSVGKTCTCPTSTSAVITGICVNCTLVSNSSGPNANNTACTCLLNNYWTWDSTANVGYCNCNSTY
jgi:hypothetical protein